MRIVILIHPKPGSGRLAALAAGLAEGLSAQGHQADVVDLVNDHPARLGLCDHVCVGAEAPSFLGAKLPAGFENALGAVGQLGGKRCYAFAPRRGLRAARFLGRLMQAMESQGMFLRSSDLLEDRDAARRVGQSLELGRPA